MINIYGLVFGLPAPIILALLLNEVRSSVFKRTIQTVSYLPYFISLVVACGMILEFTRRDGVVNDVIEFFGGERISFMTDPDWFWPIYTITDIWQGIGWGSIIYIAAITGIDQGLYEAATIDGAGRWRKMWHITLPGIRETIAIVYIMKIGQMMSLGFEKIILLYNGMTYETARCDFQLHLSDGTAANELQLQLGGGLVQLGNQPGPAVCSQSRFEAAV